MRTLLLLFLTAFTVSAKSQLILKDIFGRNLSGQNIVLVDWEGYIANPAIKLSIQAPANATFPVTVNLSANGPRLYFNTPSVASNTGPSKSIILNDTTPVSFYISIFPDRDNINESYVLTVNSSLPTQTYSVVVIDQDIAAPSPGYNIITDFSQDNPAYSFYSSPAHRAIVRQAADDWSYFIDDTHFDTVPVNDELTYIWYDEGSSPTGYFTSNSSAYSGFLLYAHGITTYTHHSGGSPSLNAFQKINGVATQLRRSGGFETEVYGNYNTLGWDTTISDDTWYMATNFGNVPNDFYSIALHEMGHALGFNPGYPVFETYKNQGYVDDSNVVSYQGSTVPVDQYDHLSNGETDDVLKVVDRISKKGAFGSEYAAVVPYGRWLISKLNLLCLQAVGYKIKPTSAFSTVNIATSTLPAGSLAQSYNTTIAAAGGIPFYKYEVFSGALPNGLTLNSFNGAITGTATQQGNYSFTIRITDYDNKTFDKAFSIPVLAVYTFTGNGDWNNAANWSGNVVAPATIPPGVEVIINNAAGGQTTFTGNLIVQPGGKLTILPGKTLQVKKP